MRKQAAVRAIAITAFGPPERFTLFDLPSPEVAVDGVLIRVEAAGVGPWDTLRRAGNLDPTSAIFPLVLGWEAAGVLEAVGADVSSAGRLQVGDAVYTYSREGGSGAYAEILKVPAAAVAGKPTSQSFEQAAALPVNAISAHQALIEDLGIDLRLDGSGDPRSILITGAAGGAGHLAVQLAAAAGLQVICTAGAANHEYVRGLGAAAVIDYVSCSVPDGVRAILPDGVDLLYDTVGGQALDDALSCVRDSGVATTLVTGSQPPQPGRGITVHTVSSRPEASRLEELARLIDAGHLKVTLQHTYPLERAADAHRESERGHVRGKLVLRVAHADTSSVAATRQPVKELKVHV